ncbi:TPA: pyridine nucleotide-disulfide oxidoreductase [Candidatus Gastranaerophilales bacterium HUM_19]|nr:MAG TPA: pyridine nucleotide-disulfide oxidoreductase [Candidatus Gastranaerophilales bacterium HUM_19]DAB19402.1 MAG TPA: pyridine nucleotide-disulfide oxidoreductase [Candidatus Gastranaerophilales bacterium HUM_17]DAB25764.1 MAG TPA: pyridine nucleotide-disulfide oxidoreductase [Candidatus Gastranaerophilales bacterium HUM_23]
MRTVIIGGGACGASTAARIRRLDESAEIIVLEKTGEISIANCGLPYYTSGVINDREKMLVSSPEKFREWFNINVKLNTEVININPDEKFVETADGEKINYDKLVLAQGAKPFVPPIEGIPEQKVFTVRTLFDADNIKSYIKEKGVRKAIVIGGGFIGVEMAENLNEMGLETTLIEQQNQILAPVDYEIAAFLHNEMRDRGIELVLSDGVKKFNDNKVILNSSREIEFDIIIMAIGVRPEITLAKNAGLETARGIIVNQKMQTSNPDIYAGGDGVEIKDFVTGENTLIPLAGPANRQGRIIADNICGIESAYKNSQGTSVLKVFDLTAASVGNNEKQLKSKNIPYWKTFVFSKDHAGYYPGAVEVLYKLLFSPDGKILGAQGVGLDGVEKRIDVISSIMRNGGKIQELLDSELCYAPPYSSAKDAVNILGMNADNILRGLLKPAYFEDLENSYLIDVRQKEIFEISTIEGAVNIPIAQLRNRINEVPRDKKVILFCNTGYTSYNASRILIQNGFNNVYSLCGGISLYKELVKDKKGILTMPQRVATHAAVSNSADVIKVDASGLQCPGPIMKVASKIAELNEGSIIEVTSTDRGFKSDIGAWCKTTGNSLLDLKTEKKVITAVIQKDGKPAVIEKSSGNGQTIVVFSNDLDKALAALIIANGAKAAGKDVTLFFTFWGLNILRKPQSRVKKGIIDKMFGLMMPKGTEKLTLSKMNMLGAGSLMMKWVMKQKNVSTLNELLTQAREAGIKFIACNMSMDVMGIKPEELIDGVEIGGVAKYIEESSYSNSNLFI